MEISVEEYEYAAPPVVGQQGSIGVQGFADDLVGKLQGAKVGDDDGYDQFLDAAEQEQRAGGQSLLAAPPMQTQPAYEEEEEEDEDEAEALNQKYETLTSKTFRMKALASKRHELSQEATKAGNPFEIIADMYETIDAMPDDDDKINSIEMWNAVVALFQAARHNEGLREFTSLVFSSQKSYYNNKKEMTVVNNELKLLQDLYDKQEQTAVMKALKDKQQARKMSLESKVQEKATKKAAEEAEKEAKKQRKD